MSQVNFDPVAELMGCLEVLFEAAEHSEDESLWSDAFLMELQTAHWQTVQLVQSLLAEHQHLTGLMNKVLQERNQALQLAQQAKGATGLIVANAGQARQFIKESGL